MRGNTRRRLLLLDLAGHNGVRVRGVSGESVAKEKRQLRGDGVTYLSGQLRQDRADLQPFGD